MPPYGCATYTAGAPSCGKMSTFISRIAMIDASATEITATMIVIGRRIAVSTNHMRSLLNAGLRSQLFQKRRQIAMRLRRRQQCSPHPEPGHRIVGFRLREEVLRFRDLGDAGESGLIAGACLALTRRRRLPLGRRVPRDLRRRFHKRPRLDFLRCQGLDRLVVPGTFRQLVLSLDTLACLDREEVEGRERD